MQTAPGNIYEFGSFQLDTGERLLRRIDGTPVPLTPRVFKTLLYMLEHHNAVLDKERIMEAVWPDSIVEENNLAQAISKLRHIFGETPGSQSYIATVPGRGYRFVAEVRERSTDAVFTRPKGRQLNEVLAQRDFAAGHQRTQTSGYESIQTGITRERTHALAEYRWLLAGAITGLVIVTVAALFFIHYHGPGSPVLADKVSSGLAQIPERSVAVLPFEPLGRDVDGELLGLGMADAVIGRMSNLKQVVVLPTSAVSKYKGSTSDPLAAGRALHVDAILSGTVQRSGDRVRVTVQLVRVASGRTIWSEKFDQTFTDIFGVQDSISENVVRSLAINLTADEQKHLGKHYTTSAAAYDSYLMGLYFWNRRSKDGLEKAINYFDQAVRKDPNFALAYALMADCYYLQIYYAYSPAPEAIDNAKAAADRALLLDESLAEAHVAKAMVHALQQECRLSVESLRRALELNPNLAIAHLRYAWCLCGLGQLNDAVRETKRAQELDPLSATNTAALGTFLIFAKELRGALAYCSRAAELDSSNYLVRCNLAIAYSLNGMFQQAIEQYRMAGELSPEHKGDVLASVATVLTSAGRKSEANSMVPEVLELAMAGKADPYNVAILCAARGDKEQGFRWLARAIANPQFMLGMLRYDPQLDPLRSDHRFAALLQQHEYARR